MDPDLKRRAWEALSRELGEKDATLFWREGGLGDPETVRSRQKCTQARGCPPSATPSGNIPEPGGASATPPLPCSQAREPSSAEKTPGRRPISLDNPVLTLAFRRTMRRPATFWVLLGYVALLGAILLLTEAVCLRQNVGRPLTAVGPEIGRGYWVASSLIQIMALGLIAAVLGATAFAVEREQRTSEALWLTRLTPWSVLAGKWIALATALGLLVFSALPLLCLAFLFGGVSPGDVARSTALVLASAGGFMGIGLACSARSRRMLTAIIVAALITAALLFGLPAIAILRELLTGSGLGPGWGLFRPLLVMNPLFAMAHLFEPFRPVPPVFTDACTVFYIVLGLAGDVAAWRWLRREAHGQL